MLRPGAVHTCLTLPRFMGQHQCQSNLETNQCDTAGDADLSSLPSLFKKKKKEGTFTIPESVCFFDFHGRKEKINTLPIILLYFSGPITMTESAKMVTPTGNLSNF